MASLAEALQLAISHHVAGRLAVAEQIYRQIIQQVPQHPDAWHLLGVVAQQTGKFAESLEQIDHAIALEPQQAAYHSNRGETLRRLGRLTDAEQALRRALELDPQALDALNNLGLVLKTLGRAAAAVEVLNRALALRPDFPEALNNRGLALQALRHSDAALADFRRAIELRPTLVDAHHNLATELHRLRRLDDAVVEYRAALALDPNYADALNALALAVHEQEQFVEAEELLRRAITVRPNLADAHANLGLLLIGRRRFDEARAAFEQARQLEPRRAKHHAGLAMASAGLDQLVAAREHARTAVELEPRNVDAWRQLGNTALSLGEVPTAIDAFGRAVELAPDAPQVHSSFLFLHLYDAEMTPERLAELAADYDRRHVQPLAARYPRPRVIRDEARPLRIGFVSADLREHPVGFFVTGVLEQLDREQFITHCYSDHRRDDRWAQRMQRAAHVWRTVDQRTDDELAALIRKDQIDILFDLAGHTVPNRLGLFSRRAAPVQVSWLGYPGTTGSSAIDFLLADRWLVPAGEERHFSERVVRLPSGWVCLAVDEALPAVAAAPVLASGRVTFGSFLNTAKLTPLTFDLWSAVLRQVSDARLILKFRGLHEPQVVERIAGALVERGIDRQRIELRGHSPLDEMLAEYGEIDVALDTFPYTGGATTIFALLMGVPLVSWPGRTMVGRLSSAVLGWLGLDDWVATSAEDYVARTVALARDPERLAQWRLEIRRRFLEAPLGNPPRFVREFEQALQQMWRAGDNAWGVDR